MPNAATPPPERPQNAVLRPEVATREAELTPRADVTRVPPPWRVAIENVQPEIDAGRFPIKRIVGDRVVVEADVFADGHDAVSCWLLYRREGAASWSVERMQPLRRDRWRAGFDAPISGRWSYTVRAWPDRFATWLRALEAKRDDDQDVDVELRIGAEILRTAAEHPDALEPETASEGRDPAAAEAEARRLRNAADDLEGELALDRKLEVARDPALAALVERRPDPDRVVTFGRRLGVWVEREKARFSTWYALFPRSCSNEPGRHGTLRDVESRLPDLAQMGFDVLYLPPIHPIGRTRRRGRNNTPQALPNDPGSPWAIGSSEGGHTSVHPQLGTLEDFGRLVEKARGFGIEVAMDLAFQCSPDHPWVREHPEWFRMRPDGSVQHAENPPKRYEDIVSLDFDTPSWQALWETLAGVVEFWCAAGVRIFRVDNPHTKPFAFWEWLLDRIKKVHPDALFLAEAFTRPRIMCRLAKLGFSQSYTYFTWRNTKSELQRYLSELTSKPLSEYFRPNFWPNTPDILSETLQFGGRPAFMTRLALAATLSPSYGIYGPAYELCEHHPREPGSEEYLGSEKYEIRVWDLQRTGNIRDFIERMNAIRRENPALQDLRNLRFHEVDNEHILAFSKRTDDFSNVVLVVVNLDPHHVQSGWLRLPLDQLRIEPEQPYQVHDLAMGARFVWSGARNFVQLDPKRTPVHVFQILPRVRHEEDYEHFA